MLTVRERAIIKKAGSRFVGAEVGELFVDRVENLVVRSEIEAQHDVRRALDLFDGRIIGLITTFTPSRFTASNETAQLRRIEALRNSKISILRTLYVALQRLCVSCYYSDDRNLGWTGYQGPPAVDG